MLGHTCLLPDITTIHFIPIIGIFGTHDSKLFRWMQVNCEQHSFIFFESLILHHNSNPWFVDDPSPDYCSTPPSSATPRLLNGFKLREHWILVRYAETMACVVLLRKRAEFRSDSLLDLFSSSDPPFYYWVLMVMRIWSQVLKAKIFIDITKEGYFIALLGKTLFLIAPDLLIFHSFCVQHFSNTFWS